MAWGKTKEEKTVGAVCAGGCMLPPSALNSYTMFMTCEEALAVAVK
jgi:hypothetical protein